LPVVGIPIVWVPIGLYQIMTGHPGSGAFILVWGFCVVSMFADYVIRPWLVGRHGHGHPLLVLIALLGGVETFGMAGLIVAPIVMALFLALLRIYERVHQDSKSDATRRDEDAVLVDSRAHVEERRVNERRGPVQREERRVSERDG
jgi:predicted PurR-regulated permease PerM